MGKLLEKMKSLSSFIEHNKRIIMILGMILFMGSIIFAEAKSYPYIKEGTKAGKKVITTLTNERTYAKADKDAVIKQSFVMNDDTIGRVGLSMVYLGNNPEAVFHLKLYCEDDHREVASWEKSALELKKDQYYYFSLEHVESNAKNKKYSLSIWYEGLQADERILLNYANNTENERTLHINDRQSSLSTIFEIENASQPYKNIFVVYIIFNLLLLFGGCCIYIMIFVKKSKIENIYTVAIICLGIVYLFIFPPMSAADEGTHMATAYSLSNTLMGKTAINEDGRVIVRNSDNSTEYRMIPSIDTYRYEIENLFNDNVDGTSVGAGFGNVLYKSNIMYLPSAVGLSIARIIGLNSVWTFNLGKIFVFLVSVFIMRLAVKIIPFGKYTLIGMSMFPMVLEQITSYSYDAFVISMYMLMISYLLYLIYKKEKVTIKDTCLLAVGVFILTPCKVVYFLMLVALVLCLPKRKFEKKNYWITMLVVFLSIGTSFGIANKDYIVSVMSTSNTSQTVEEVDTYDEIEMEQTVSIEKENTDESDSEVDDRYSLFKDISDGDVSTIFYPSGELYSFSYCLQNPVKTIKICMNTIIKDFKIWMYGLIGYELGWLEVAVNINLCKLILLVFMFTFLFNDSEAGINHNVKIWHRLIIVLSMMGISILIILSMLTCYTNIGMDEIMGVQGRYFLPLVPLLIPVLALRKNHLKRNYGYVVLLILYVFNILVFCSVNETIMMR